MSINFANLVAQGRAKAMGVPWSPEELESLLAIERERGISRVTAADFVRNGIMSVADYDKAVKAKFKPTTLEEAHKEMDQTLKARGKSAIATKSTGKK